MRALGGRSRSRLTTIMLFGLLASFLLTPVEAAGPFVIQGTVTDIDGTPIAGALVESYYEPDLSTTTDENGKYRIEYLLPTYDYLRASAQGRFSRSRSVSNYWDHDPVDFALSLRISTAASPSATPTTEGLTLEVLGWTGPRDGVCMRTKIPGTDDTIDLTIVSTDQWAVTATASYSYPSALSEGIYYSSIVAYRCDTPRFTLGTAGYSLRVDASAPSITNQYPVPGSTVPEDEVIPSFRISDVSGYSRDDVIFQLTDLTTGEQTELQKTFSWFGSVQGSAINVLAGHHYRLSVDAVDTLGNAGRTEWEFFGGDPVPTPTVVKTAPYDYGERCERFSAVFTLMSSCLSEPSALRDGRLTLALAEASVTRTAVTMGYRFMGAGVKYTVPRTGDIEATADFAYADGEGQLCILVFGAVEGTPIMSSCGPLNNLQVKLQFRGTTGQALRIGGYLLPECTGEPATAQTCHGAAIARLDKVTVEFRGAP